MKEKVHLGGREEGAEDEDEEEGEVEEEVEEWGLEVITMDSMVVGPLDVDEAEDGGGALDSGVVAGAIWLELILYKMLVGTKIQI